MDTIIENKRTSSMEWTDEILKLGWGTEHVRYSIDEGYRTCASAYACTEIKPVGGLTVKKNI